MNILEATKIHKSYGNKLNKQEVLKGIDITSRKRRICQHYGCLRFRENNIT